jgi:hypothetical protein
VTGLELVPEAAVPDDELELHPAASTATAATPAARRPLRIPQHPAHLFRSVK